MAKAIRLRELAAHLNCEYEGDGDFQIRGVGALDSASPTDLAFVRSEQYAAALQNSKAGAVILPPGIDAQGRPAIRSGHPGLDFARAVAWLKPPARPEPGIHASAVIAPDAQLDPSVTVGARTVVGAGCAIGPGSVLHANVTIYDDVEIGSDCTLHAGAVIRERTRMGDRVVLQPGVVIGSDGFGYTVTEEGKREHVPQIGRVVIGDDVEIGANTTIDCAALGETRIGRGTKIDNLVMIGHGCEVGEDVFIVSQAGLSGSTVVGDKAIIMAQAGTAGHLRIGDRAFVSARGGITKDVPDDAKIYGFPQMEQGYYRRTMAVFSRLPDYVRRLREVERRLGLRGKRDDAKK